MTEWADRIVHTEWCRAFLEHNCVLRSPPGRALLIAHGGHLATWQVYMPVALLDPEFGRRIGLLFWDRYLASYRSRPFQLCGCESGGSVLTCVLQASAYELGFTCNIFQIRKEAKEYALKNWLEGIVIPAMPVLMVDDMVGKKATLTRQTKRVMEFGLPVIGAFAILAALLKPPLMIELPGRTIGINVLYGPDQFALSHDDYVLKYGKPPPPFQGSLR